METHSKMLLPPPNFEKKPTGPPKRHFLTPSGMTLLPREKQPPPMYGKRGSTVPAKYLRNQEQNRSTVKNDDACSKSRQERQFCETCEMELQSQEDLRRHIAQHEPCPVDGCRYRCHMSVLDKHVAALHTTGLFDKFKKLSTPEEIAAWRAERRKKFPTVANVEMRHRAEEQRQKRGERLKSNQNRFGKYEDRKRIQKGATNDNLNEGQSKGHPEGAAIKARYNRKSNKRRRGQEKREFNKSNVKLQKVEKEEDKSRVKDLPLDTKDEDEMCGGISMFKGTNNMKEYEHLPNRKRKQTIVVSNALSTLVGMYGSDDDDSNESANDDDGNNSEVEKVDVIQESEIEKAKDHAKNIESNKVEEIVINKNHQTMLMPRKENSIDEELTQICTHAVESTNDAEQIGTPTDNCTDMTDTTPCEKTEVNNSSDEAPDEAPIGRISDFPEARIKSHVVEPKTETTLSAPIKTKTEDRNMKIVPNKRKYGLDYRKARLRKQNTMLEKLLEPDIRHERNVLLQCVRFVCENNFFDVNVAATKK